MAQKLSFICQLKNYGFHKLSDKENNDKNTYYHELFLHSRPELVRRIQRNSCSSLIVSEINPNFSTYKSLPLSSIDIVYKNIEEKPIITKNKTVLKALPPGPSN